MIVFLKGQKLWRYVTGSIPKPVPKPQSKATTTANASKTTVTANDYEERLEEWESIQSKILSWFINTSIPSIHNLPPRLETAKAAWKFLADCYNCTNDSSLEFHIKSKLYQMCQEIGQSISDFYSQTSTMWEQLFAANPPLVCSKDTELFVKYRNRRKFMHFMIGLLEDLSLLGLLYLASLLLLLLMLQSRSSFLKRTVGLLITFHHLIMYWLHHRHNLPLLHSLLFHE